MARKKAGGTTPTPTREPDFTAGKAPRPKLATGPFTVTAQGAILKDDDRLMIVVRVLDEAGTRTLESAKLEFSGSERDKWTDELENLSPDELKYKM